MIYKPLSYYTEKIARGEHFAFSRYGDGEWNAIFGLPGQNCDGHLYFKELGKDLSASILAKHPAPFHYARGTRGTVEHGVRIHEWLAEHHTSTVEWYDCDVFLEASLGGYLLPFVQAMNTRDILYVGPSHIVRLSQLRIHFFVETPLINCYLVKDSMLDAIRAILEVGVDLVLFSAGMASNVLISELYPEYGSRVTFLDLGSLFDVYCGVKSRKYARNPNYNWLELKTKNLGNLAAEQGRREEYDSVALLKKIKQEERARYAAKYGDPEKVRNDRLRALRDLLRDVGVKD